MQVDFDLIIRGATVYPGDGPPLSAAVGVLEGRIAAVETSLAASGAAEVLEAGGLALCPGFVDMHAHSALVTFGEHRLCAPKTSQGFTTELIHPDGLVPAPVAPGARAERQAYLRGLEGSGPVEWPWSSYEEYLDALEATRPPLTLVPSVGHNSIREHVMGGVFDRPPTAEELRAAREELRRGFAAGARTLSFGLVYLPGTYAGTDELVVFAEEAARVGAPLVPHVRNEGDGLLEAIGEMIEVARRSGAPLHVSHLKARARPDLVEPLLELLDAASADVDLTFDQYPYGAGSTVLSAILPTWAQEGGAAGTLARLADADTRRRIRDDVRDGLPGWENMLGAVGPEQVTIANAGPPRADAIGHTLAALAEEAGCDPVEAACRLLLETALDVTMIAHYATEEMVRAIARHRLQLVGSDSIYGARPHPRLYGTAPRFLGRYALREGLLDVEEAVARLTARAADRLGLADRGRVRPGLRADLVLLDPAAYVDTATYDDPCRFAPGVHTVWVAGEAVWHDGEPTGARPGGVVRNPL